MHTNCNCGKLKTKKSSREPLKNLRLLHHSNQNKVNFTIFQLKINIIMEEIITNSIGSMIASHQEPENFLCKVCGKILGSKDTFKRHWKLHVEDTANQCSCGYQSPGPDAFRRHLSTKVHHTKVSKKNTEKTSRPNVMHKLETRPYQANPNSVSSYLYQQTMPKHRALPMDTTRSRCTNQNFKTLLHKRSYYHTSHTYRTTTRS